MPLYEKQITKVLIRLRGCSGWYAPLLLQTPKDRFSCMETNIQHYKVEYSEQCMCPLTAIKIEHIIALIASCYRLKLYCVSVGHMLLNHMTYVCKVFYTCLLKSRIYKCIYRLQNVLFYESSNNQQLIWHMCMSYIEPAPEPYQHTGTHKLRLK